MAAVYWQNHIHIKPLAGALDLASCRWQVGTARPRTSILSEIEKCRK